MNMRIISVHNALGALKFFHNVKTRKDKLRALVAELTEKDWEAIKQEFPGDYNMLMEFQKFDKAKGVEICRTQQLSL